MNPEKFAHFLKLPFQPHAPGVQRRLIWGEQTMFANYDVKKGVTAPEHSHPNEQITFVAKGALKVSVENRDHILREGDAIVIPSNISHSIESLEDSIVFEIFSPPRQEWII